MILAAIVHGQLHFYDEIMNMQYCSLFCIYLKLFVLMLCFINLDHGICIGFLPCLKLQKIVQYLKYKMQCIVLCVSTKIFVCILC